MTLRNATPAERLWARVDQSAGPDGCWPWTGYVSNAGYGQIGVDSRIVLTHRLAYELSIGEIPAKAHIDHICHESRCCNPQHLRVATVKQNLEHRLGANKNSISGIRGVSRHAASGLWRARVTHNGEEVFCKYFPTKEEAAEAARLKRLELFTHNDVDRSAS